MVEDTRISWDEYFMEMAKLAARRSTCLRRQVGAVIVQDKHVIATGYNGAPKGIPHCAEMGGCYREQNNIPSGERHELCRALHAEQNAICQAAKRGISIEGGTLYCRMTPCRTCTMLIINCGIKRVVCQQRYHVAEESEAMLKMAGIELEYKSTETVQYKNQ